MSTLPFGTFAWSEQVLAEAAKLTALDRAISLEQAAMLTINPTTAGLLVESRDLPAGAWVVQNAANSGVGRSVIAFAKERGLRTINIVRREELVTELEALGADIVLIDSPDVAVRVRAATGDDPVLLGLDGVSGKATSLLLDVLTDGALLLIYGYMSGEPFTPDQNVLKAKNITTTKFWMYQDEYLPRHPDLGAESARLVAAGKLRLPSAPVYQAKDFAMSCDFRAISGCQRGRTEAAEGSRAWQVQHSVRRSSPRRPIGPPRRGRLATSDTPSRVHRHAISGIWHLHGASFLCTPL
ncbi:zinc-dependent alcohol dehydrogenase family protein [Streptomyces avermitilis]